MTWHELLRHAESLSCYLTVLSLIRLSYKNGDKNTDLLGFYKEKWAMICKNPNVMLDMRAPDKWWFLMYFYIIYYFGGEDDDYGWFHGSNY